MKSKRSRKKDILAPLSVAGAALSELMTFVDLSVAAVKDAAQARHILYWNRMAKRVLGNGTPSQPKNTTLKRLDTRNVSKFSRKGKRNMISHTYTVWQLVDCGALLRQWSMI